MMCLRRLSIFCASDQPSSQARVTDALALSLNVRWSWADRGTNSGRGRKRGKMWANTSMKTIAKTASNELGELVNEFAYGVGGRDADAHDDGGDSEPPDEVGLEDPVGRDAPPKSTPTRTNGQSQAWAATATDGRTARSTKRWAFWRLLKEGTATGGTALGESSTPASMCPPCIPHDVRFAVPRIPLNPVSNDELGVQHRWLRPAKNLTVTGPFVASSSIRSVNSSYP